MCCAGQGPPMQAEEPPRVDVWIHIFPLSARADGGARASDAV